MPFAYWRSFAAFVVGLGFSVTWVTLSDRRAAIAKTGELLESASIVLLEHAERAIEDGDKVARAMLPEIAAWDRVHQDEGRRLTDRLRSFLPGSPQISSAWVVAGDGGPLLNTLGYPPLAVNVQSRPYYQAHAAGVSDPFLGPSEVGLATGRPRFTVSRALRGGDGSLQGVFVVAMYSDFFAELYRKVLRWPDTTAALAMHRPSGSIQLLSHMRPQGPPDGLLDALKTLVAKAPRGREIITLPDGPRLITWQSSTINPGLVAHTSQSLTAALADWRSRAWSNAMLVTTIALLLAVVLSMLARADLARRAAAVQELLTREVHHRVKNNLAIIASLVRIADRQVVGGSDARQQLARIGAQIQALANLHGQMQYQPQGETLDLSTLMVPLTRSITEATGRDVEFTSGVRVEVGDDRAMPILIVVNELITNAVKHGRGPVRVHCDRKADSVLVAVTNDRDDVPASNPENGFGTSMVRSLVESIGGKLSVTSHQPMRVELTVPLTSARS